ncbi:hypothetical protein Q764_05920 [Flavobacterium suncheonense GH29-5 = DSM 17707]|uniref:Uncharacterized protein n=2 Tax=Flavobacterium suncheonense TaxID=350894 RepID=A0A0A2MDS0_9FLAO|nr:hypothetical protein Q764_05920 [Flavobacterium suncheonense GH29-5 = DSM 17707]
MPTFLRKVKHLALLRSFVTPLVKLHDDTLYKIQHDGRTIYLEKLLNEYYQVTGYDTQNHEATKLIYIDDLPDVEKLYIYQNEETEVSFLEDDGDDNEDDVFLDADNESYVSYSWIIFMPDTISFEEIKLRALVDSYRYAGKKYTIQTYTP